MKSRFNPDCGIIMNQLVTTQITRTNAAAIHFIHHASLLGPLIIAATAQGICGIYFEQHKYFNGTANWRHSAAQPHLTEAAQQLDAYFSGTRKHFDLSLDLQGTPFQRSVWKQLTTIEFGATISYGEHAQQIGKASAVRAVGSAIGRNPVSIIVPCHRVIGRDGSMAGYAGGLDRKRFLLEMESRG